MTATRSLLLYFAIPLSSWTAPHIFFTDLVGGPRDGGVNGNGVFVTIKGRRFGPMRGSSTVTFGGGEAASYTSWSDSEIVVQPGPAAQSGGIVVTVNGEPSNSVPFTVRRRTAANNRIFCFSSAYGDDRNNGMFPSDPNGGNGCWQGLAGLRAKLKLLNAGDTVYFGRDSSDEYQSPPVSIIGRSDTGGGLISPATAYGYKSGNDSSGHIALVRFPGATATLGGAGPDHFEVIVRNIGSTSAVTHWVLSGLRLIAGSRSNQGQSCVSLRSQGWRIVNNDCSIPAAFHASGIHISKSNGADDNTIVTHILGNLVHGIQGIQHNKYQYGIYATTDANQIEIAWNVVDLENGINNRCVQLHSSPTAGLTDGYSLFGVLFHDNRITNCPGYGLNVAGVDPSKGLGIKIYNNIFQNAGNCLAPWTGDSSSYSGIGFPLRNTSDYNWTPVSGTVRVYNNTFYDIGGCSRFPSDSGLFNIEVMSGQWASSYKAPRTSSQVVCPAPCTLQRQQGMLDPGPQANRDTEWRPYHIGFRAAGGSGEQAVVDDGQGNLVQNGNTVGRFDYLTGTYEFEFERPLEGNTAVTFCTIHGYRIDIRNNIFYLLEKQKWYSASGGWLLARQRITAGNNIFYSAAGMPVPAEFHGSIEADPLFADPGSGDFRLLEGSPAIDGGGNTEIAYDLEGMPRTPGSVAIGALEGAASAVRRERSTSPQRGRESPRRR